METESPLLYAYFAVGLLGAAMTLWSEVAELNADVKLKGRAQELGLGRGDDRLRPYIAKIPGCDR